MTRKGRTLLLAGLVAGLLVIGTSAVGAVAMFQDGVREVVIDVNKPIDVRGLHEELESAGFAVVGVSTVGEPCIKVRIQLDPSESKDPAGVVASHDAAACKRVQVQITWAPEIPELEPRIELRRFRKGLSPKELDAAVEKLKANGALSVTLLD